MAGFLRQGRLLCEVRMRGVVVQLGAAILIVINMANVRNVLVACLRHFKRSKTPERCWQHP